LLAVALLTSGFSSPKADASSGTATGSIKVPGTSNAARVSYLGYPSLNGTSGFVVPLGGAVSDGTPYVLTRLASVGTVTISADFYSDLFGDHGEGDVCVTRAASGNGSGGEDGTILCGDSNGDGLTTAADHARYAIVTIDPLIGHSLSASVGGSASFKLKWGS